MITIFIRPTAIAELDGVGYQLRKGSSTKLDATAVPFATSTLVLPLLDEEVLEEFDPREGARVPFETGDGVSTRPFDLGLRSREVDHKAKTVTLSLASDEALLRDYAPLVADTGARAHQASARAVCNYVLGKIGASLEAGADDANVTAYWGVTNLFTNPSGENTSAGWVNGSLASGLAPTTGQAWVGSYSLHWQATGAGQSFIDFNGPISVQAGRSYVFDAYMRATAARPARLLIRFKNAAGVILADRMSAPTNLTTTGWQRIINIQEAPPGATHATAHVEYQASASGQFPYVDGLMFHEGTEAVPYFDGSTADSGTYTYDWSGTAHASTATRTPVVERRPEMFVWQPGVPAWEFLLAILTAAGLVLWCDERRKWRLARAENRTIATLIAVSEANTRDGTDTLSRDDADTFVTGVVVVYRWRDIDGTEREGTDSAGTPGKVLRVDIAGPFPGRGAAAAILARRQGSGRRQEVTTVTQLGATPGMTAQISLPGAPDTIGRVASVEFDHASGLMALETAGLVDLIPGSIAALVGTIDSLTGTIDSL